MKRFLLILIFVSSLFAQEPGKKWIIVQDLQDRIVYLDTSAIKEYDNQISFWGLTRYREAQRLNPFNTLVKQVKSNFLVNTITNTYSVIGTLYYDKIGKIVGESSAPRITGQDKFELPVQPGSSVEVLYNKAVNYLQSGTFTAEPSEFTPDVPGEQRNNETAAAGSETEDDTPADTVETDEPIRLSPEDNIAIIDEQNKEYLEKQKRIADSIETASNFLKDEETTNAQLSEKGIRKPNPPDNKADVSNIKLDKPESQKNTSIPKYNDAQDQNVSSNIWTDGTIYVIQLSSWRREDVAQEQVQKYKADGHNAYIMQVQLPGRGTWYRVRIGYFNSLQEAQNYKRENNF